MTIQIGTGLSQNPDSLLATREAYQQACRAAGCDHPPDWILLFFNTPHMEQSEQIHDLLAEICSCVVGGSFSGVLTGAGEVLEEPAIALMIGVTPGVEASGFVHFQELEHSMSVMQQVKETLEQQAHQPLLLTFPDTYEHQPHNLINTLNFARSRPVAFGAASCNDGTYQQAVQVGPRGAALSGVSGITFSGIPHFQAGVTQACVTMGEPMFITEVRDNQILKLDDFPALEVFITVASELGIRELETAAQHLLFSLPLDRQQPSFGGESALVRGLTGVDVVSQGLELAEFVQEGMVVSFAYRSAVTAEQDFREMLQRLKQQDERRPSFGVYLNCAARGTALYGRPNVDTEAIREVLGEFPLIGCFGGYELGTVSQGLNLYTHTGVLLLAYLDEA